ncbi:MAG: hypothetical protein GF390_01685 [Candidatus Pacebacteria bacterium]|nr:hypothetical protein [Candidatus Paceibacterota bacterium]
MTKLMRPQQYTAKLEDKIVYNPKFTHYFFELIKPHRLQFQAGQYVSIPVNDQGLRRSYSICSTPSIEHGIEIVVDLTPGGPGSQFFQNLQLGQQISFLAPLGDFVLTAPSTQQPLILVATGSGIAPFRSMILHLLQDQHDSRPLILYWGLRHAEDMIWQDEFQELSEHFSNFQFHPVLSQAPTEWPLCRGRVTDCLALHQQPAQAHYYLCGSQAMIKDVKAILQQQNVAEQAISHEKFF